MSLYKSFLDLHYQDSPFILGNVWNIASAKIMEAAGAVAIGSSSSAIADTLGFSDGEQITFNQLLFVVKDVAKHINIPFTVDLEGGYSRNPIQIAKHVEQLADNGVVGMNFEDSVLDGGRVLLPKEQFRNCLLEVRNHLDKRNIDFFINVRVDPFIVKHEHALNETLERIAAYELSGADGIFVPLAHLEGDIAQICSQSKLPINILLKPNLPSRNVLAQLGVKRISLGNGWYDNGMGFLKRQATTLLSGDLQTIFQ